MAPLGTLCTVLYSPAEPLDKVWSLARARQRDYTDAKTQLLAPFTCPPDFILDDPPVDL